MPPFPIPTVTSEQEPTIKVKINKEWVTFVLGALEDLFTPSVYGQSELGGIYAREPVPVWDGDETQQFNAEQEVQKLLLALAIGNLMLEDLIQPGEAGTIIQSDGENWIVVMPSIPDSLADLIAPGAAGDIIQSDGANWQVVPLPAAPDALADLLAVGAIGTVIQSDGSSWIVTTPEFQNLVAKTLNAGTVPLTVRGAASQSANLVEVKNSALANVMTVSPSGSMSLIAPGVNNLNILFRIQRPTTGSLGAIEFATTSGNVTTWQLGYQNDASSSFYLRNSRLNKPILSVGDTTFETITLFTNNTKRFSIDGSGQVGIGNITPSALLDIDSNKIRIRTAKTPASATDTGNAGDVCWDANYFYICVAANTWKRIALSSW